MMSLISRSGPERLKLTPKKRLRKFAQPFASFHYSRSAFFASMAPTTSGSSQNPTIGLASLFAPSRVPRLQRGAGIGQIDPHSFIARKRRFRLLHFHKGMPEKQIFEVLGFFALEIHSPGRWPPVQNGSGPGAKSMVIALGVKLPVAGYCKTRYDLPQFV
jgi:hypothetical protein